MTALTVYRTATGIAGRLPISGTAGRAVRGRRRAVQHWIDWAAGSRTDAPLVWIHGASVGESLTAAPVVRRLCRAVPTPQIVHSFSSPSVERWPSPFPREFATYVPWDNRRAVERVLAAVQPSLLVFSRGDLWPELVMQARGRAIPVTIIGGAVTPTSWRLRWPARRLYHALLPNITWIGAATPADAARWIRLGAPADRVQVTGDPRHDEVLERVPQLGALHTLIDWAARGPTFVAASLEPPDVEPVCEAAARVLAHAPDVQLLLVPHNPAPHMVNVLERTARTGGLPTEVWMSGTGEAPSAPCVIVQARGLLFDLYALAAAAYVGGGFLPKKLHTVIEPAAFGLPVTFGPHWQAFPDAAALVTSGGAVSVPRRHAAVRLAETWLTWASDPRAAGALGLEARRTLEGGAAHVSAAWLRGLLRTASPSTARSEALGDLD